jgi:hypothetical protein
MNLLTTTARHRCRLIPARGGKRATDDNAESRAVAAARRASRDRAADTAISNHLIHNE